MMKFLFVILIFSIFLLEFQICLFTYNSNFIFTDEYDILLKGLVTSTNKTFDLHNAINITKTYRNSYQSCDSTLEYPFYTIPDHCYSHLYRFYWYNHKACTIII